jgi:predicted RNase H-like HicB family nuclease
MIASLPIIFLRRKMSGVLTFPIEIEQTETGDYLATSSALPGFLVECETIEGVYCEAPQVARALLDTYREKGLPIPPGLQSVPAQFTIPILVPA